MRHGYYMTRNRSFLCERALEGETYEPSKWTVVVPHRMVEEIESAMGVRRYNIWYLYAKAVKPEGEEQGRWLVERMIGWDVDQYGVPRLDARKPASEIAEALDGRVCISTLMTVSDVNDPPSPHPLRLMQKTRTPGVCLIKNDGSGDNASFYRSHGRVDAMATMLLPVERGSKPFYHPTLRN